jgi:hypothetical protein
MEKDVVPFLASDETVAFVRVKPLNFASFLGQWPRFQETGHA